MSSLAQRFHFVNSEADNKEGGVELGRRLSLHGDSDRERGRETGLASHQP